MTLFTLFSLAAVMKCVWGQAPTTPPAGDPCPNASGSGMCYNGGTCTRNPDYPSFEWCECALGYHGFSCETYGTPCPNCCQNAPCWNGGTCYRDQDTSSVFWCECSPDYFGRYCETHVGILCFSEKCQNGGKCLYDNGDCTCLPGWSGKYCEIPIGGSCDTTINLQNDCSDTYNTNFHGMSASLDAMHDSLIDLQTNQITCTLELLSQALEAIQRQVSHACLQVGECCDANNPKEPDNCSSHCCPEECTLPIYPAPPGDYMVSKCIGPSRIPLGFFAYPGRYLVSSIDGQADGEGSWVLGTGLSGDMCFQFCENNQECHAATYDCRTKVCTGWTKYVDDYRAEAAHCGNSFDFNNLKPDPYSYHVRREACYNYQLRF